MPSKPKYYGCLVEDCDKAHYAKQYCRQHWAMWKRYGLPYRPEREPVFCVDCDAPAFAQDMCKIHYQRWWYTHRQGRSEQKWYKKEVGYAGAHGRIRAVRGHAKDYACVQCGGIAGEWALKADADEANVRLAKQSRRHGESKYSLDVYDYQPMCQPCHRDYDANTGNRHYKTGQYARANGGNDE